MAMPAARASAVERSASGAPSTQDLAVEAAVRVDAGEDLEQRRLAGAVLAAQAEDLAGARFELGAVERDDAAEALANAAHGEARAR